MSTLTNNINLTLPTRDETYDIEIVNENNQKIDSALGKKADLASDGKLSISQLPGSGIYIVEKGSDGPWDYVKWSDGTYTANAKHKGTIALTTASSGTYYNPTPFSVPLPSFSTSVKSAIGQAGGIGMSIHSGIYVYRMEERSGELQIHYRCFLSMTSAACAADIQIEGTWA